MRAPVARGGFYAPCHGYRGNTNVKIGLFKGDELAYSWRVSTVASHTADEYGMVLYDLLRQGGHHYKDIDGAVMSSVAPSLNYTIEHMCSYYTGKKPLVVDHRTRTGMRISYDNPSELGADRIVGAAAAMHFYGAPGGAIAPGVKTATESLVHTAAKLPRVELSTPDSVVGTSTRSCMQSGIIYGYTGLVKYMVERYRALPEMQGAKVVATGGLSALIDNVEPDLIDITDRALALKGLKHIYDLNLK